MTAPNSFRTGPDERGHFGQFGGRYVAETLMPLVLDLDRHYRAAKADPAFQAEFDDLLEHYVGRPSPLYFAPRLTEELAKSALPGGQGLVFDWTLLSGYRGSVAWGLAGGLSPDNVGEALRITQAPLVDVSSGVESAPGVKDVDRIAAFCKAARKT